MNPRFIWAFAKFNGMSWILKAPYAIVSNIVMPLSLLFIIEILSGGRLLPFVVVGGIIAIVSAASLSNTGMSATYRLEFRIQELLVATKTSTLDYILGFAMSDLFFCLPGLAIFTALSVYLSLFTFARFAITLIVIFMLAIAVASISVTVGTRIRRTIGMWSISGILSNLLSLIPPTFYPYTILPKPVLFLLALSPVTPAAVALQGAYGIGPVSGWALPLLALESVFYLVVVSKLARWRDT